MGRDTGEPEPIDRFAEEFSLTSLEKKILDNYLSLPSGMRENFMDFLVTSVHEVMEETTP